MKRDNILLVVVAMLAGLLGGYLIFSIAGKSTAPPSGGQAPMGAGSSVDYQQRITELEKVVAQEPKNRQAWIQLGNDYFDTEQPQKAITAYQKALDLDPNNPGNANILTDQGVMFRKMGWFDKAIANFEQSQKLDPKHQQSLYNLGIVYGFDLKQADKAIAVLTRYLQIDATSPQAQQVKQMVEQLKTTGRLQ